MGNAADNVGKQDIKTYDVGSHRLDNVEIFAVGTHNGDSFSVEDLDEMVRAFGELDYKPPLKQGHMRDIPGMPALGYIESLKRVGTKLIASFSDIPTIVMDAIGRKSYNGVSAEIYFNLERAGKKFGRALKAVALLGADIPAVAGLAPLSSMFDEEKAMVKIYDFATTEDEDMSEEIKHMQDQMKTYEERLTKTVLEKEQLESDNKKLREEMTSISKNFALLAKKDRDTTIEANVKKCKVPAMHSALTALYELAHEQPVERHFAVGDKKDVSAIGAVDNLVAAINNNADRLFKEFGQSDINRSSGDGFDDAQAEVDRRSKEYVSKNNVSYGDAMRAVLASDADLRQRYNTAQN